MGVCNAEASLLTITETRFARGEIGHMVEDMKRAEPGMKWVDFAWLHVCICILASYYRRWHICTYACVHFVHSVPLHSGVFPPSCFWIINVIYS